MGKIELCINDNQHFWLPTRGKGMESYSCPMCGQLVYWSEINLIWVKPATSGDKSIPGNASTNQLEQAVKVKAVKT